LAIDPDVLFEVEEVDGSPPARARVHASVRCAVCDENVMETRVRRFGGQELCQPCFEAAVAAS
ncbi:MAG TPA: TraR/DksA C4-type zinc finger protein, partial [Acidimicrobiales bacterium]|nr:TraR/DksA C4-type zinc finger protein [Acidimicrobiales bacterium]